MSSPGDFAILVSSGLTMKRGLCFQAFSLSPMYAGLIIGVLLGTTLNLTDWIFAVTAGMFLFVALAEMVSVTYLGISPLLYLMGAISFPISLNL